MQNISQVISTRITRSYASHIHELKSRTSLFRHFYPWNSLPMLGLRASLEWRFHFKRHTVSLIRCFKVSYVDDKCLFRPTLGVAKRKCLNDGVWGYPDYGECISQEFNQLQEKVLIF